MCVAVYTYTDQFTRVQSTQLIGVILSKNSALQQADYTGSVLYLHSLECLQGLQTITLLVKKLPLLQPSFLPCI